MIGYINNSIYQKKNKPNIYCVVLCLMFNLEETIGMSEIICEP